MRQFGLVLFICLVMVKWGSAQTPTYEILSPMLEPVSNNAVTQAEIGSEPHVFSFCGLDSTKSSSGIHLKAWRYDVIGDAWESIPDVPDVNGGKIAAGASTVKGLIYIIGGYHVTPTGNEISSSKVHIYDPNTNTYTEGADIPKAIDDHVQIVWRDSLIYVITGWSNTNNVTNVQIYNPSLDSWKSGTSIPSTSDYRVFGATGVIIDDDIYYVGGAGNWNGNNFPPTSYIRRGEIDPTDPSSISWAGNNNNDAKGYRMASVSFNNEAYFIGGSDVTYNYDGIAYNGTGGVPPNARITSFNPAFIFDFTDYQDVIPPTMDLRGAGHFNDGYVYICGGMAEDQKVTAQTLRINLNTITSLAEPSFDKKTSVFPNPATDKIRITLEEQGSKAYSIYNGQGKHMSSGILKNQSIEVKELPAGLYYLQIFEDGLTYSSASFVVTKD